MFSNWPSRVVRRGLGVAACGVLVACPSAQAQSAWDAGAFGAVMAVHSAAAADENQYVDWFHMGQFGVAVGRHITRHVKFDVEAAATGTGRRYIERYVTVSGSSAPYPIGAEAETSFRSLTTTASYQFFDNEWVHPFVTAGVTTSVERRSVRVWDQYFYRGDPRLPGNQVLVAADHNGKPKTVLTVQGVLGGGVKLYMSERAFLRADGRASLGAATQHISFRAGLGIDF
jgi:hypothetical protein